jgi:thiamine transport system permease protein
MDERGEARTYAALPALYLALFFLLPVAAVLATALGAARDEPASLVDEVQKLAANAYYRNRILFTVGQAVASTALTLVVGLPLAYVFSHHEFAGRRVLRAAFTAPFVLPAIVVALALHAYVGPRSLLGIDLLTPLGPVGAILLAHVFYNTSLVLRVVGNHWERLPPAFADAARTLGATRWQALRRAELPLLAPAIAAASLLVFTFDLTSFGVILLLGGDHYGTIETLIYEELRTFRPHYGTAAALALLQLVVTYLALSAFVAFQRRSRSHWAPQTRTDRRPLTAAGAALLVAAGLLLLGPPLALVAMAFRDGGHWSLRPFELLATNGAPLGAYSAADAVANSLRFALAALALALVLAWLAALAVHRARRAAWAEGLLLLPLGLSSVVLGLGLLLSWNGAWLPDLRTSGLRIVLAHALVAFPFASRILAPTLDAVSPALREAGRTLGATPFALVRRLEFPLAYPALGVAAVYAFGASLGEFGAALLLRRPETVTVPIAIYEGFGHIAADHRLQANALAAALLLVAVLSFLLLERFRIRAWGEFA